MHKECGPGFSVPALVGWPHGKLYGRSVEAHGAVIIRKDGLKYGQRVVLFD